MEDDVVDMEIDDIDGHAPSPPPSPPSPPPAPVPPAPPKPPHTLSKNIVMRMRKTLTFIHNNIEIPSTFSDLSTDILPNLVTILRHNTPPSIPQHGIKVVEKKLLAEISKRASLTPKRRLILFTYTSHLLNHLQLDQILRDKQTIALLPASHSNLSPPIITFKTDRTLGSLVYNYAIHRSQSYSSVEICSKAACSCSNPALAPYRNSQGHVSTTNLGIISNTALRNILACGSKLSLTPPDIDHSSLAHDIYWGLSLFTLELAKEESIHENVFDPWLSHVYTECMKRLESMKHRIPSKSTALSPSDFRILKDLKSKYIFHPTDKSAQDFAITCKAFYYANLLSEYDTTKTYHALPADTVPASLTGNHLKFTSSLKLNIPSSLTLSTHLIPYAVQYLKAHKDPFAYRHVAASRYSSLKPISSFLTKVFKVINPDVERLWIDSLKAHGLSTTRSWIISNSDNLKSHITKLNASIRRSHQEPTDPITLDFSTLYTTPTQGVKTTHLQANSTNI
jgi:hypothetical protein